MPLPRPCEAPEPTGCTRHDAVVSMLHHLETTYEWKTGWDDRSEDTYCRGEMLSYRRISLPNDVGKATFIFCEDKMHSYCYIMTNGNSCTVLEKEDYDEAIAALEKGAGCFAALVDSKKTAEH